MKKYAAIFVSAFLGTVSILSVAFGADNMIVRYKNGQTQTIELDQILSIEFKAGRASYQDSHAQFRPGKPYSLVAKHSGKCLDVSGVSKDTGANVYQWDCHGGPNQQWTLTDKGDGYYTMTARHSGKCLDVSGVSKDNGANIYQWDCHGGPNQQWQLIPQGQGYYMVTARHSGKCLDVSGSGRSNGDNVHQWDCHGGNNQLWQLK